MDVFKNLDVFEKVGPFEKMDPFEKLEIFSKKRYPGTYRDCHCDTDLLLWDPSSDSCEKEGRRGDHLKEESPIEI